MSAADLEYFNLSSIPLADGSGFAAELGVHHELHCLVCRFPSPILRFTTWGIVPNSWEQKKIRHWIYREYYLAEESEVELEEWKAHIRAYKNLLHFTSFSLDE